MKQIKPLLPIILAVSAALPGLYLRFFHPGLPAPLIVLISGISILCSSFILLWASDLAQADISQSMALALVALIVVLPEYAVDMYFTWQAGKHPTADYAHYSIANMTGANRLLIGIAWSVIAVLWWVRTRRPVELENDRKTEIAFLGMATVYAFLIPAKGSLEWYDGIVLMGIYAWYIKIVGKRPCEECEFSGPVEHLSRLPKTRRRLATLALFLFSAGTIWAEAEIFSEGLVASGKLFGINEFLLVQWLAPLASEAPEFTVAIMLSLRGHAGVALGSLLSAKLNQWTLLVGMIPGVYALSRGTFAIPIPMDAQQMHEILLTAAQSLFAVVLIMRMRLSLSGALVLVALFIGQFIGPPLVGLLPFASIRNLNGDTVHVVLSFIYIAGALVLFATEPSRLLNLRGAFTEPDECCGQIRQSRIDAPR